MLFLYGSLALVVASMVVYHLTQKSLSATASPFAVLTVAYGLAMILSLVGALAQPVRGGFAEMLSWRSWPVLLLALSLVGIEMGVLLTYRAGGKVSTLPLLLNGATMACLVPIGILFFREQLNWSTVAGAGMIIAGMWIMLASR